MNTQDFANAQWMMAWQWIIDNWGTPEWKKVPSTMIYILHLPLGIGVCNHQLVTREGAEGMREFITRLNRK